MQARPNEAGGAPGRSTGGEDVRADRRGRLGLSTRAKAHLLIFVAFPVGALGLGLLGLLVHQAFLWPAFVYTFAMGMWAAAIRCPKCGRPVILQTYSLLGHRVETWWPYVRKCCEQCGHDLGSSAPEDSAH